MIHVLCVITFAAIWYYQVRSLKRKFTELQRTVSADCAATRGQARITRDRVEMLRKNAGAELEVVSERLCKVEERKTVT